MNETIDELLNEIRDYLAAGVAVGDLEGRACHLLDVLSRPELRPRLDEIGIKLRADQIRREETE